MNTFCLTSLKYHLKFFLALNFFLLTTCANAQNATNQKIDSRVTGKISEQLSLNENVLNSGAIDSIVAIVNSTVITRKELNDRSALVEKQFQEKKIPLPSRNLFERQVLERLILENAQLQLARENGIRIEASNIDRTVAKIAEQNRMSLTDFRKKIESEGITFTRFREEIENELLLSRLKEQEVDSRIQISESEIDNLMADLNGHKNEATQINLAQILFRIAENASPNERKKIQEQAENVLTQLRQGADFFETATSYTPASEQNKNPILGLRSIDKLPTLFTKATENLQIGELTMVRSANGYHILKLLEKVTPKATLTNQETIELTRVRHILMRPTQTQTAQTVQQRLNDIRQNILNGQENFENMAKKFSIDGSAAKGGDLGWVYPGDTVAEFEYAMKDLQPGEISPIIETQFGFHIVEVMGRKTQEITQERQRAAAREMLKDRKSEEAFQEWLRQLRDRTYVETRLD